MSSAYLIAFKDGKIAGETQFQNSWGGSARIWTSLFDKYVTKKHQYDTWRHGNGDDRRLWDLASREDLPTFERAVHAFTFDRFYVRRENFDVFIHHLREFAVSYPRQGICHLNAWADWIQANFNVEAVSVHGTSVCSSPWRRPKQCPQCKADHDGEDEEIPLSEGTEVYDWLKSL